MFAHRDAADLKRQLSDPHAVCLALGLAVGRTSSSGSWVCCPNPRHHDTHPSCLVSIGPSGTLRYKCWSCGLHGDVFDLIALVEGFHGTAHAFVRAMDVAQRLAVRMPSSSGPNSSIADARAPSVLNEQIHHFLQVLLELCPLDEQMHVVRYLARRRVLDGAVEDGWGALPGDPYDQGQLLHVLAETCRAELVEQSGLSWIAREHHVLIPWRAPSGDVVGVQVRRPNDEANDAKYVTMRMSRMSWPYGVDRAITDITPESAVIFVEGAIDALAARALARMQGLDRVVLGLPSASGWKREWATLGAGREVAVAVDADPAGDRVADQMNRDLRAAGARRVVRVRPVEGTDWAASLRRYR